VDNIHSIYVDQWDWEKVISRRQRTVEYLEDTVRAIVGAVCETNDALGIAFPSLHTKIQRDVKFITTQELEDMYPDFTAKEREDAIAKKYGTVFLMQIGKTLKSGQKHDGRAPDYDDWDLNGDILIWNEVWGHAFEFDGGNNWEIIERFADFMAPHADKVWFATNGEIIDYVNAWKRLEYSADGSMIYNPSALDVTIRIAWESIVLKAGTVTKIPETPI